MSEFYGTMPSEIPHTLPVGTKWRNPDGVHGEAITELLWDGFMYRGDVTVVGSRHQKDARNLSAKFVDWSTVRRVEPLPAEGKFKPKVGDWCEGTPDETSNHAGKGTVRGKLLPEDSVSGHPVLELEKGHYPAWCIVERESLRPSPPAPPAPPADGLHGPSPNHCSLCGNSYADQLRDRGTGMISGHSACNDCSKAYRGDASREIERRLSPPGKAETKTASCPECRGDHRVLECKACGVGCPPKTADPRCKCGQQCTGQDYDGSPICQDCAGDRARELLGSAKPAVLDDRVYQLLRETDRPVVGYSARRWRNE